MLKMEFLVQLNYTYIDYFKTDALYKMHTI